MKPLIERLILAQVGSCTCVTKTPEPMAHAEDCRYRVLVEAASALQQAQRPTAVTLTAKQLHDALSLVNPDGPEDEEQMEAEVTIVWREAFTSDDNEAMAAGYYAHITEYPEEGVYGPLG